MFRPQASFSRLLERATSPLQLAQDPAPVTEMCALIRRGDTAPGPALAAVTRRAQHNNPHVALYALQVILMHQQRCMQQCMAYLLTEVFSNFTQIFGE